MMPAVRIVGGTIVTGGRSTPDDLVVDGDRIVARPARPVDTGSVDRGPTTGWFDATGLTVAPGFVDLQINGGFGFDLLGDPDSMWALAERLPEHGVTAFLPTIITAPRRSTDAALAAWRNRPASSLGAEPLGLHFEGPMLSPARKGAHPAASLLTPSSSVIEGWTPERGVRLVTIAPELPGAIEIIAELVRRGVTVSCGHTAADADDARQASAVGARMVTHLFNAMDPLTHRSPPLLAHALAEPDLVAGIIVDGVHVDPAVVKLAWKAKGPNGLALVTDAVAPMGRPAGSFDLGRRTIVADGVSVRQPDGTLAGSLLTMDQAVRNTVRFTGCEPADAITAATATPADLIGALGRGRLDVGSIADIVVLDDRLGVVATFCAGRLSFVSAEGRSRLSTEWGRSLAEGV